MSFLKGNLHHPAFAIALVLLCLQTPFALLLGGFWALRLYRGDRRLLVFSLLLAGVFFVRHEMVETRMPPATTHAARIVRVEASRMRALVKTDDARFYAVFETLPAVTAGDDIVIHGASRSIDAPSMPGEFDYMRYLKARRIGGIFDVETVEVTGRGRSLHNVSEWVERRIDERFERAGPYLKTYFLADRSALSEDFLNTASLLGISHLFAVSGLHVSLLCLMVHKALSAGGFKKGVSDAAIIVLMGTYIVWTAFSPSVVRAASMAVLFIVNRRLGLKYTPVDVCAGVFVGVLFVNPHMYALTGFVLTFLVSFSILLFQNRLQTMGTFMQILSVSALAFFVSLPVASAFHHGFNPFTIAFNVLFVAYASFVLMPLTYLTFVVPYLDALFHVATTIFETLVLFLGEHFNTRVRLYFSQTWLAIVYVALLYAVFVAPPRVRLRRVAGLGLFLGLMMAWPWLKPTEDIVFFHVHGDSILIRDRHNRCNILIDTGHVDSRGRLVNALKSIHVTHLDYVLISHWHLDHYGELDRVLTEFNVDHVICSETQHAMEDVPIACGGIVFFIYPLEAPHRSENDRSMVVLVQLPNERLLLTGDIEGPRERSLRVYDLEATLLKVPHHGSATSSSDAFLRAVAPQDAVVTTHRNNPFGHPDPEVIERLTQAGIEVHRTDVESTIFFRYIFGRRMKITPFD